MGLASKLFTPMARTALRRAEVAVPKTVSEVTQEAVAFPKPTVRPESSLVKPRDLAIKEPSSSQIFLPKPQSIFDEEPVAVESSFVKQRMPVDESLGVEPELIAQSGQDAFEAVGMTPAKKEEWRKVNKASQRSKLLPEIEDAAQQLSENKITSEQFRKISQEKQPIIPLDKVPEVPTYEDIAGALTESQVKKGVVGVNMKIPQGERVSSRLDIPAYNDYNTWVVSLHEGNKKSGAPIGYAKTAVLRNVEFVSDPKVALDIARRKPLASGGRMGKATIARIFGDWVPHNPDNAKSFAEKIFNDPEWTQVGMNPYRGSYFYDKADNMPVVSADEVVQIGPLVMAKNVKKTSPENPMFKINQKDEASPTFANGGSVPQTRRMLADGGMMQEGGTTDPVSGNDVPMGSLQEEVRDDVNAQLSPGEFVLPADVVRYIGLERLMKLRDEAKQGLQRMNDVGQMGNAESAPKGDEAFQEDDSFESDIDEIMSEVDDEEMTKQMAAGGFISGSDLTKAPKNPALDVRYFKNAEGRVLFITHINGKPMTPIPNGYTETDTPAEQLVGSEAEKKDEATKAAADKAAPAETNVGADMGANAPSDKGAVSSSMYSVDEFGYATPNTVSETMGKGLGGVLGFAASMSPALAGLGMKAGEKAVEAYNAAAKTAAEDFNMSRQKSDFRTDELSDARTQAEYDKDAADRAQVGESEQAAVDAANAANAARGLSTEAVTSPVSAPDISTTDLAGGSAGEGIGGGDISGQSEGTPALAKGGFIAKKAKPNVIAKSKKGLASRK